MKKHFLILFASLLCLPAPSQADPVRFTGRTTADARLAKDTLQNILLFSSASMKCDSLSHVEARVIQPGYVPADPKYRVGTGKVVHESWTATLCGKRVKFLISFWGAADGGTDFGIGYPYPPDAP